MKDLAISLPPGLRSDVPALSAGLSPSAGLSLHAGPWSWAIVIVKLLFENPWLLFVVLVAIQFGLTAIWIWQRTRVWARTVGVSLAAMPVLLLLSHFVVTPRERVIELCQDLAALALKGDVGGIGRHLSDDFEVAGLDRVEFLARVEDNLQRHRVENLSLHTFEVLFQRRTEAIAVFNAVCTVSSDDIFLGRLVSRWRLTFQDRGRSWQVLKVEALRTPLSSTSRPVGVRNVRDWLP